MLKINNNIHIKLIGKTNLEYISIFFDGESKAIAINKSSAFVDSRNNSHYKDIKLIILYL